MKNDWEKKEKTCSAYLSSKIFATSARVWTRSTSLSSFQRSNWSPTYILHLFHLEDTSLLFIFLSESVKVRFLPRVDTFSFAQEPYVVYCFKWRPARSLWYIRHYIFMRRFRMPRYGWPKYNIMCMCSHSVHACYAYSVRTWQVAPPM